MVKFDIKDILKKAEKDYENTWIETSFLIPKKGKEFKLLKTGRTQPVMDFIQKIREEFSKLGFEEVILPTILQEDEVYKEYGPEASIILDRVFYLAGLPRADIGLSETKKKQINKVIPNFKDFDKLQELLRNYKKGEIEADDLIENMVVNLNISEQNASKIIDTIFLEFKKLKPLPTNLTLRSHMTALWFPVLRELVKKLPSPIQLFTIGEKFRREQSLDATHLYTSFTASCVIYSENIGLDDGIGIAKLILRKLGFEDVKFIMKKATSKYYAPKTEFEIYVFHPERNEWVEIGNGGFYSPISLAKYGIDTPVFNIGFGVERFVMILENEEDIRKLVYPYFYKETIYNDKDIAESVFLVEYPKTEFGKKLMNKIINTLIENKDKPSPISIIALEEKIGNKFLKVIVWENDEGVKLLGPAALNEIWVKDGNIIGILPDEKMKKSGISTNIRYIDSISALAAAKIEKLIKSDRKEDSISLRIKIAKQPSDINIDIPKNIRRFITSHTYKIDVRGPIFIGISADFK